MNMNIRKFELKDLKQALDIWNEVINEANAFPQEFPLSGEEAKVFFTSQTYVGVAEENGEIYGVYILHPNNVGRVGHICNASFAVSSKSRGMHIGEKLVVDCLLKGKENGFRILQLNAVVEDNLRARKLYEKLGFKQLGVIPNGFRLKDGTYKNICPYYVELI